HLHRVARVAQVGEVDALHHPAGVDVQARDDADGDSHQPAARPAGSTARTASRAWGRVKRPAYSALPTIEPSMPTPDAASSASATRSDTSAMPPDAITGASVAPATDRSRSRLGPRRVPSLLTSV